MPRKTIPEQLNEIRAILDKIEWDLESSVRTRSRYEHLDPTLTCNAEGHEIKHATLTEPVENSWVVCGLKIKSTIVLEFRKGTLDDVTCANCKRALDKYSNDNIDRPIIVEEPIVIEEEPPPIVKKLRTRWNPETCTLENYE